LLGQVSQKPLRTVPGRLRRTGATLLPAALLPAALLPAALLPAALLSVSACGGLIETDAPPTGATDSTSEPTGSGGALQTACSPAQWDCSGQAVDCSYVTDSVGQRWPVISVTGRCECDASRPTQPGDCAEGELLVCGNLSVPDQFGGEPSGLAFEPVSCRCVRNAGYYCGHCIHTGLYESADAAGGCGLDSSEGAENSAVMCGCGP